jgi:AraC-like DNA-binding protein
LNHPRIQETVHIELLRVEEASYTSLDLVNLSYPFWVISHVLDGRVTTKTLEESFAAGKGDVMIHPPNIPFSEYSDNCGLHQWMMFEIKNGFDFDMMMLHPLSYIVPLLDPVSFMVNFRRLHRFWANPQYPLRELACLGQANVLLFDVMDSWLQRRMPGRDFNSSLPERIAKAVRFMLEHLDQNLTREQIAEQTFLHSVHFDRIFKEVYHKTPKQLLKELRLKKAKSLLQSTRLTLSEIASRCGLGDAAYLSRCFVKQLGITPGQYRETAQTRNLSYVESEE